MARDLFAELGASTAPAANASTGGPRDLFAEIEQKPDAKHPGHTPRRTLRERRVVTKPTDEQNAAPEANRGPRPGNVQAPLDRGTSAPVAQTGMGLGLGMSSTMQDVNAAPETPQQRFERESNDRSDGRSLTATRAPKATVGNIASGLATSLGEAFTQTERGAYMAFEENTPLAPGDTEARRQARVDQALREIRQSQNNQALARPDIKSTAGNYAYDTADSVLQSTPAIVGGILSGAVTANPFIGTATGLGLAGGQTGAQAYGKYRERGATPGEAALGAAGEGAIEVGTELLPMGALVEKFGKVGARKLIAEVLGKEMVGEQIATFTQDAIDTAIANPNKTWAQYWEERPDAAFRTGLAVLAQTGLIGGASRAVQAIGERLDRNGRLATRNPADTRTAAPGVRQTAVEQAAVPTPEDIASPLDTATITAGKVEIAKATAGKAADAGLQSAGMPQVGKRVVVDLGDGTTQAGTMEDWFEAEDGKGVVVRLDNGRTMREYTDTLADAGVSIREAGTAEADAIDARLAAIAGDSELAPTGASSPLAGKEQAAPSARPVGNPVADGGAVIRSIFGDGVRITSQRRQKDDPLTKKNPGSWHAKSNAAVDMAPIQGTTFEATKARIEAAGYTLIEAIDEVKNPSKHATGPHWHFVIGEGKGAAPAPQEASQPSQPEQAAAPEAPRDTNPALIPADATPEGKAMRGPAIDEEWSAFPQQSGTLAIPRGEMPQVKAEHRGAMVNFLNARGVAHEEIEVPASSLKPTQAEYSSAKVEKAKTYEGGSRAILISSDGHVLDGHHQWMAALDKGENVRAIRLDAPIRDLVNLAHEFPSSTVEDGAGPAAPAGADDVVATYRGQEQARFRVVKVGDGNLDGEFTIHRVREDGSVMQRWNGRHMSEGVTEGRFRTEEAARRAAQMQADRIEANFGGGTTTAPEAAGLDTLSDNEVGGFTTVLIDSPSTNDGVLATFTPEEKARLAEVGIRMNGNVMAAADVERLMAERAARQKQRYDQKREAAAPAPQPPASTARVEPTPSGKGVAVVGASEAELAAIAREVPQAKGAKRSDGAWTYSLKHADAIRAAIAGVSGQQPGGAPSAPTIDAVRADWEKKGLVAPKGSTAPDVRLSRDEIADRLAESLGHTRGDMHNRIANAIHDKDFWTLGGMLLPHNKKSRKVFTEATGIKLPESRAGTEAALRDWAGISQEEIDRVRGDAQAQRDTERADREREYRRKDAENVTVRLPDSSTVNGAKWVDDRVDEGFNRLVNMSQGAVPKWYIANSEGRGYPIKKELLAYARDVLATRGADVVGEDGLTEAERNDPNLATPEELDYLFGKTSTPPASIAAPAEPVGTAPEHAQVGVDDRELAEIVRDFDEVRRSQGEGDQQVTHVFDPPAKSEIVRLQDKVKVYVDQFGWMTPAEAKAKIAEWKAHADKQGGPQSPNRDKVVLSLFDLTGKWSQPWVDAGYQVYRFDIQDDPEVGDVHNFSTEFFSDWFGDFDGQDIYAILAACPCTDFASSGARHFAAKDADGRTVASVKLVQQTLATIEYFKPAVWAIENPVGRIEKLGGLPPWRLSFDPNHLGETYTKKTLIWGRFNADLPIAPADPVEGSKMHSQYGGKSMATKNARSATPEGFAYGFFMANNAVDHPVLAIHGKYDRLDRDLIDKAVKAGVTAEQIDRAVEDPYYMEQDDEAANQAIRDLIEERRQAKMGARPVDRSAAIIIDPAKGTVKTVPLGKEAQADRAVLRKRLADGLAGMTPVQVESVARAMGIDNPAMGRETWASYTQRIVRDSYALDALEREMAKARQAPDNTVKAKMVPLVEDQPTPDALENEVLALTSDQYEQYLRALNPPRNPNRNAITSRAAQIQRQYTAMGEAAMRKALASVVDSTTAPSTEPVEATSLDDFIGKVDAGYRVHYDYAGTAGRTIWLEKTEFGWTMGYRDDSNPRVTGKMGGAGPRGGWSKAEALRAAEDEARYRFTQWKPIDPNGLRNQESAPQADPTGAPPPASQAELDAAYQRGRDATENGFGKIQGGRQESTSELTSAFFSGWEDAIDGTEKRKPRSKLPAAPAEQAAPSKFAGNKLFTEDKVAAAKARMAERMKRLNSGVDPEMLMDGITIAGAYIEAGVRNFAAFAKQMRDDFGPKIQPYLLSFWEGTRYYPGLDTEGMTDPATSKAMHEMMLAEAPVTGEGESATGEVDAQLPNRVPAGDAGSSTGDVQGTSQDRGNGRVPGQEGGGSQGAVRRTDQGAANAAERGAGRSGSGEAGDRAGVRATDRVPAGERDAGRAGNRAAAAAVKGEDWTITPGSLGEERSMMQKARDNVAAIELVKKIEAEGRPATREEQASIARYIGWGGLKNIFPDTNGQFGKGFEELGARLRDLLTPEEYQTAQRSIQYAHYTAEPVVRGMWEIARQLGFKGGLVFEPGMGTGNFRGMMPADIAAASQYQGIEYDHLTASIAKLLYPQSGVRQADYTATPQILDAFDLVIGNPPFSETTIGSDPAYAANKFVLHDFFFAKSLDAVKPGGLLMFISSAGTMNKAGTKAREYLADRADLVGAIRLPGDAFKQNAGTEVTTDIVILRKRMAGEKVGDRSWVDVAPVNLFDRDGNPLQGNVNRYFIANPEMILGEQGMFDKLVAGPRYAVRARPGFDMGRELAQAAERLPFNITGTEPAETTAQTAPAIDFNSNERKDGSFYIDPDGRLMQFRNGVGQPVQGRGKGTSGGMSAKDQEKVRALVPIKEALREVYAADIVNDEVKGGLARQKLNEVYDAFVKKHGPINKTEISYRRPSRVELESLRAEAREEARLAGGEWDDGSFNVEPFLADGASMSEIARARAEAREAAIAAGRVWNEGTFDPDEVPDKVVEKYPNLEAFIKDDEEGYRLAAIEHFNKDTGEAAKGRAFFENAIKLDSKPKINSADDALLYSLNRTGRPDLELMARMAGRTRTELLEELGDRLFEVPGQPGAYETAEMYLSGDVREKLALAREAAARDSAYARNVRALEAAQPAPLTPSEISANLGMPWIPPRTIEQFATEHMGLKSAKVSYLAKLAAWSAAGDSYSAAATSTWGTERMHAMDLLQAALNRQTPQVFDRTDDGKRVLNAVATQAAQDKMAEIKQAFRDWIWKDEDRSSTLVDLYNTSYNSLVAPRFDGSYLTTPGIASGWSWRPHQRQVIARIIQAGNTYMAHEVGAGKTSAMIGAGMEMKRLGLVNKPMYVVPNHMLGQFTKEFYEQYPLARIRVADETRFHTSRRKEFIARMAADDLDAVIITHSAFGFIPMSDAFTEGMIQDQIDELADLLREIGKGQDERITRRRVEQQKEALEQRLKALTNRKRDQVFTFEETGVDFLFVDEAHLFRKLDFATKMGNVKGIDPNGSAMSFDLYAKSRFLEQQKPSRNLVLASGTPITNTMAELYSVSRYLQQSELEKRGLGHFDAWAGAFGDTVTNLEQDPAGGYKPVTRFAQFVNVPELSVMVRQVMDVVGAAELRQYVSLPTLEGGERQMVMAEQTPDQQAYQAELTARLEVIRRRSGPPAKGDDIILTVINDGRKAAIDYRLIDPTAERDPGSKLERMIDNVARLHKEHARAPFHQPLPEGKGFSEKPVTYGPATQMIFSDFGINGPFPVHKYIRQALVAKGIPANQIAIISDFKTHVAKQRLFNDMNEGKVRVLIGSVAKMGTGVNAQKRLRALHNMDAQWYPANDTQRNGRIIRQGNMNPQVGIYDYATKGTYDSTMWGLMAKKAKFIEGFMRGDPTMRDMEDLGEASQYEQAQAMTTADPRMMDLTEWKQDLEKLQRRKIGHERDQQTNRSKIRWAGNDKADAERLIPLIEQDIAKRTLPAEGEDFAGTVKGQTYNDPTEFGAALMEAMDDLIGRADTKSGSLREPIGEFAGFALVGETHKTRDGPSADYVILRAGKRETSVRDAGDARGLTTRLTNAVNRFEKELAEQQYRIESANREIAEFTPRVGIPFTEDDKIAALRAKIDDLESTLDAETKAREAAAKAAADAANEPKQSIPEDLPPVTVRAADWGKLPSPGKQRLMILRQRAMRWYDGLIGTTVQSSDGRTVLFNREGKSKALRGGEALLLRARAIPKIIQRGRLIASEKADRPGFKAVHTYAAMIRMEGEPDMALTVNVREAADGTFHYSLNRYVGRVSPNTSAEAEGAAESRTSDPALDGGVGDVLNLDVLQTSVNPGNPDLGAELQARLEGYGIARKVALRVVDTLGGAAGDYSNALIRVASDTTQAGTYTLDHEAVHAMRDLGLINQSEWAVLSAKARRDTALMRSIRARYARLDTEGQTEEAVADMFARYQRGDYQAEGTVARVFKALRGALEAIGNYLRGRGAQTAGGVMQRMASGEVGARGGAAPAAGGGRQSFAGQTDTPEFKRWFGNSKVIDEGGKPMVVHHWTFNDFTVFNDGEFLKTRVGRGRNPEGIDRIGNWFTSNPEAIYAAPSMGGKRMDVYLSMENPLYIDENPDEPQGAFRELQRFIEREGGATKARALLKDMGYDGIILSGTKLDGYDQHVFITFDPEQIKSATGNVGTFDPANPDIRFSMPERDDMVSLGGQDPTWRGKMAEAYEQWRTRLQDRYMPLLKVQREIEEQTGKPLPLSRNPYMGEELMTGRIGAQLESLAEDHVEPLFDAMHAEGVTIDELETYLYARHAPERNARIAEINPEFEEGSGSGMTDIEARAVMNRIKRDGKMPAMQRWAARVDAIREMTLDTQVRTGLISKADADELRATYKHYVPLRGFKEVEDADPALADRINRSGGGINVRGRESKAAYGRRSQADSPLAYLIMQAEGAIVRGETNLVAQQFVNLAKANPDEEFWQVNKVTSKQRINEETGLVERYLSYNLAAADADWTVSAKFGGVERRVTMNRANPAARRLADAMRNLTQHQLDWVTLHLGKLNRFLSAVNTSYNPEFVITNAFRDLQTAAFNLGGEDVQGMIAGTLRDYPSALKASTSGAFGKGSGEWGKWYDEFVSNGGRVYFNRIENIAEIKQRMAKIAAMSAARTGEGGLGLQAKRMFVAAGDMIDNLNNGVENAVRLAVYKNARERGLSPARAASMAKNVTVNFNRRGTAGPALNAAYLFFNASVQGSARIFKAMRSPRVRKMMAGVMITGAMVELLNAFMSAIDDDGEPIYDKVSDFDKERNIILMLPGGQEFVKIPMPYGYNVVWNAGRTAAEIARRGGDRWKDSAASFLTSVLDAFNPIGGADSLLNLVSPTVTDPIVDLALNRDFTGKPIMPEDSPYGPQEPDHKRYWNSVAPHWKAVTDFLNEATGGDDVTPGAIDVSPETLEYLSGTVIGSAGAFLNRMAALVSKGVDPDEEVTANDIPFARKVTGSKPSWYDKGAFYDRLGEVEQQVAYTKGYIEGGDIEQARAFARENLSVLQLEGDAKVARRDMRQIRKAKREVVAAHERGSIDAETYRADMRKIGDAEKLVIRQFNSRWNAVVTNGGEPSQ